MPTTLNRRERKAAQLLKHYATCERLAIALGMDPGKADGKRISVALFKLEREAHRGATAHCNGETFTYHSTTSRHMGPFLFGRDENAWGLFQDRINGEIRTIFGKLPPGSFVNGDARGYSLKIDPENSAGKALIESAGMHTDWGGNGILSPTINGDY